MWKQRRFHSSPHLDDPLHEGILELLDHAISETREFPLRMELIQQDGESVSVEQDQNRPAGIDKESLEFSISTVCGEKGTCS